MHIPDAQSLTTTAGVDVSGPDRTGPGRTGSKWRARRVASRRWLAAWQQGFAAGREVEQRLDAEARELLDDPGEG